MEARGEIRGGRFVSGFTGEQFARPEALDLLRAIRRSGASSEIMEVPSADPLNLTGIILPGARVSPLAMAVPVIPPRQGSGNPRRYPWQRVANVNDNIA